MLQCVQKLSQQLTIHFFSRYWSVRRVFVKKRTMDIFPWHYPFCNLYLWKKNYGQKFYLSLLILNSSVSFTLFWTRCSTGRSSVLLPVNSLYDPFSLQVPSITLAFSMTRVATVRDDKFRRTSHHGKVVFKMETYGGSRAHPSVSLNQIGDVRIK